MRASKAKQIRRALRAEIAAGAKASWVAHPSVYTNVRNETMLKYIFQYIKMGTQLTKMAKKIYRATGLLPR